MLRWIAGRQAGIPEFDPPYTIEVSPAGRVPEASRDREAMPADVRRSQPVPDHFGDRGAPG